MRPDADQDGENEEFYSFIILTVSPGRAQYAMYGHSEKHVISHDADRMKLWASPFFVISTGRKGEKG